MTTSSCASSTATSSWTRAKWPVTASPEPSRARVRHLRPRPAQELRRRRGGARNRPRGRARARSSPSSARTAPGRPRPSRSSRATASATPARSPCSAAIPSTPTAPGASGSAIVLQSCRLDPYLTVRESLELYAGYYRSPRSVEETIELVGLERQGRCAHRQPLRWPAAPARRRHGADRRSRAALPRRADDRLRSLGPAPGLGDDRRPARPRQDGLPHHPLHGRGAAARRPGRRSSPGGQVVARGTPEDLGDREGRPTTISYRLERRSEVSLETTTPVDGSARADRPRARPRGSSSRASRRRGRASRTSTSS